VLLVFSDVIFSGLQVHTPEIFPVILLTWGAVKDVTGVAVLKAFNFVTFELDRLQDFGGLTAILNLFRFPHLDGSVSNNSLPAPK